VLRDAPIVVNFVVKSCREEGCAVRIAVVNNFFPPRVGGSSHLADALAQGYARAGHDVIVLTATYGDAPVYEERDGLQIFRIQALTLPPTRLAISFDLAFTTRPSLGRRIAEILDSFRPDVIHQHGQFFDLTWATGAWARRHRVPVLLSVHTRLESPSPRYSTLFAALDRFLVAPLLRRFMPTFVVMDVQMEAYIRSRYPRAIGGMVDIPVGVDSVHALDGDGDAVRRAHSIAPDAPVVLSIGHVIQMRDRMSLIEALPAVRDRVPGAKVVVVGKVFVDGFETRARQLGVSDMVISTGAVPRDSIKDYLAAASVECHDLQGYGLGTASLESMAAGVPVVAAVRHDNFAGIELATGQNCWLVEPGDSDQLAAALIQALTDREHAHQVGLAGQELVAKNFTMDSVLQRHLDVLERLTADD
jgi:glycosyltransferase involved in cell wall biosynthesis